jgi:hypothetical protein
MLTALKQAFFLLASFTLAASAHASFNHMRLEGLSLLLAFALTVSYGLFVDLVMFVRLFRHRAALVICSVVGLALAFLLLSQFASPSERRWLLGPTVGPAWVALVVTSAVFVPFIVIAPFAQYAALRHGRRWPGWITAWMVLQLALPPVFLVLAGTEPHFREQEYAAGRAAGHEVRAGGFGRLLQLAEQRHERIWGTGWAYPWRHYAPGGLPYRRSAWIVGLAKGMDDSAPIAANEPLSEQDRTALQTLRKRGYSGWNIVAKLIWDALEPGGFARQLAPFGIDEQGVVSEEVIPALLERLEKYGAPRLCPGGRMMEADRAVLNAVILKRGRDWSAERVYELRPEWDGYRRRVERLCRGPE